MQVSYKGFVFIFNFEMADKILKPGYPKGVWLPSYLIYKQNLKKKKKKRQHLNINDRYLVDSTN